MMETLLSTLIVAVIAVLIVIQISRSTKKKRVVKLNALALLLDLRSLIAFTQKHRGMSASYLQGTQKALKEIQHISKTISPIVNNLKQQNIINQQDRWLGFIDHWGRLSGQVTQLSLEQSFEQHTSLISNLLYLFEDIAEQQAFNKETIKDCPNIDLLWQALPFASEYIGQSRAIGVAIAAKGVSTQVDKVKLGYLETKITQLSQTVFSQLEVNQSTQPEQIKMLNAAKDLCQSYTQVMRSDLLDVTTVTISSSTYFEAASLAMDAINRILDAELQLLKEKVTQAF
ncbi:nitrate- and nitrite sensing domain-containing protein [Paraglaciecola sp.]|uniref:nitrate- and nitrite sensing domain-containing protein n=1 Tax=Paraglaciecola sp. TaxID=1920173 RepID=UPI003EFB2838